MSQTESTLVAQTFQDRFGSLLRATEETLGCQIRVRYDGIGEITAPLPPAGCVACSVSRPDAFASCVSQCVGSGESLELMQSPMLWNGPDGCEVAVLPLRMPYAPPARLIAVREASGAGSHRARPEMLRFLSEMVNLLTEHFSVTCELANVSERAFQPP